MKPEELFFAMQDVDDEYVTEAMPKDKAAVKRKRFIKRMSWMAACLALFLVNVWLFLPPPSPAVPDISAFESDPDYELIEKINSVVDHGEKQYKNNLAIICNKLGIGTLDGDAMLIILPSEGEIKTADGDAGEPGVVTPESVKVVGDKIYYSSYNELDISEEIPQRINGIHYGGELLLGEGNTVISVQAGDHIDVYDKETKKILSYVSSISGTLVTCATVGESLIVVTKWRIPRNGDAYSGDVLTPDIAADGNGFADLKNHSKVIPDNITSRYCITVTLFDRNSLEQKNAITVYSVSNDCTTAHITAENVFITTSEYERISSDGLKYTKEGKTDIYRIAISGDKLEYRGDINIQGFVEDESYMDEKDGVLRVVSENRWLVYKKGLISDKFFDKRYGVSLYLISLGDEMSVVGSNDTSDTLFVSRIGEISADRILLDELCVYTVGYDGDFVYIGTSFSPVQDSLYSFCQVDLSDIDDITFKKTEKMQWFTTLIDYGEYFVGVGDDEVEICVYKKSAEGGIDIESVYTYTDHTKRYEYYMDGLFIDRERMLLGLLTFNDKYKFEYEVFDISEGIPHKVLSIPCDVEGVAIYVEGWVYVFDDDGVRREWVGES